MIDYQILADSIKYYEYYGFNRIESPWTVTEAISAITRPPNATDWTINEKNKVLVASAEQSFLYLFNKGFLPDGSYQSVTPCFRNDPFDAFHTKYFMKNELICTVEVTSYHLKFILSMAKKFFEKYLGENSVEIKEMGIDTYDLMYKDIELGSYGIRKCDFLHYVYGTAVAEPRLTRTMQKYGLSQKTN